MSVNISTSEEVDRMLSLRASNQIPLPREIALCEPSDARSYFQWLTFYEAFGLSGHPLVILLGRRRLDAAMACSLSKAAHLDRVSHYGAYLGKDTVRVINLVPTRDDPKDGPNDGPNDGSEDDPLSGSSVHPCNDPVDGSDGTPDDVYAQPSGSEEVVPML